MDRTKAFGVDGVGSLPADDSTAPRDKADWDAEVARRKRESEARERAAYAERYGIEPDNE